MLGPGECTLQTGELVRARECFERAAERLAGQSLPVRVPAVRGRAVSHYLAGELRYAVYILESAIDELNRGGLPDPDALLLLYASVIGPTWTWARTPAPPRPPSSPSRSPRVPPNPR
ncbi:hypothetical protein S1361_00535 [Streptomyces cyanogenus]|uniref:Uncharacterized protein n=1 Tax=Streptomyces cyanogenus TaxID=80860 RepID=A0ABX7TKB2_STRCY|nr:hypothetical protein S1361_00535 [Streptomyces cyanogenus]